MTDNMYMQRAIRLAERGKGRVNPNPLVGAVIVKGGRIIGEGWHERYIRSVMLNEMKHLRLSAPWPEILRLRSG